MGYWLGAGIAVAIIALVIWFMARSWGRRAKRDAQFSAYPVPDRLSRATVDCEALYVATTPEAQPLERLALPGLAFRGAARVEVSAEGLVLRVAGESASFLPADRLVGAAQATWAIDRGVEPDGLVSITWIVSEPEPAETPTRVDSYLRARYPGDAAGIIAAVNEIAAAPEVPRPQKQPQPHESEASDD